jgi:hypothetical protein
LSNAAAPASPAGDPQRFDAAWTQLRADHAIQFDLPALEPPPPPPAWIEWLRTWFEGTGPFFQLVFWIAVALLAALVIYALVRRLSGAELDFWKRRRPPEDPAEDWRPEEAPARALLAEADALAAAGRFDEAAHLLLFRSIEEIDHRRPQLVRPALTSREIVGAPELPAGPRGALAQIVGAVEQSLFAGRLLGEEDWRSCRSAYESFAFARGWGG